MSQSVIALLSRFARSSPHAAWAGILGHRLEAQLLSLNAPVAAHYSLRPQQQHTPSKQAYAQHHWPQQQHTANTALYAYAQHRCFSSALSKPATAAQPKEHAEDLHLVRVVLLKDVVGLGTQGDVCTANSGWVRHKLFPSGAVVYATPDNLKHFAMAADKRAELQSPEELQRRSLAQILRVLARQTVRISRQREEAAEGEGGREQMVGTVTAFDIQNSVARQLGIQLHESHFLMDTAINEFGTFKVPLNLRQQNDVQLELNVAVSAVAHLRHGHTSC